MEKIDKERQAEERLAENNRRIQILSEINLVLQERQEGNQRHNQLLHQFNKLQNQVEQQSQRIQNTWAELIQEEENRGTLLDDELKSVKDQVLNYCQQESGQTQGLVIKIPDTSDKNSKDFPSRKANYKITASRLQSEIKSLQHRVNFTKLRLLMEIKNKTHMENEVRQLRLRISSKRVITPSASATPLTNMSPRPSDQSD